MFPKFLRKSFVSGVAMVLTIAASDALAQYASSHSSATKPSPVATAMADPSGSANAVVTVTVTGKTVAKVNGVALTDLDLLRKMYTLFPYAKQHNGGFPKGMESDIRHGAMKMIVFEELCYQEALRRKMTVAPARIAKIRADIRGEVKDPAVYQVLLKDQGNGTEAGLRKRIERMLLIEDLIQAEINRKSLMTPLQVRSYYDKNQDKFKVAETVSFQSISIVPPANSNAEAQAEARKRADSTWKEAKSADSYEKFGLLAEKSSDDDFRVNMGYRKPVEVSKLPPSIAKILTTLKPGQVSEIVAIDGGYTILRLVDHNPPTTKKFLEVKAELKKYLEEQKQEQLRAAMNDKLRAQSKVEEL